MQQLRMGKWIFILVFLAAIVSDLSLNGSLFAQESGFALTEGVPESTGEEQDESRPEHPDWISQHFFYRQRPSFDCLPAFYSHHAMDVSGPPPDGCI